MLSKGSLSDVKKCYYSHATQMHMLTLSDDIYYRMNKYCCMVPKTEDN